MFKLFTLSLVLLLSPKAQAAPCTVTPFYDGFSGQFFNSAIVNGFIYGLDETFLYVTLASGYINGYINIPQSVATAFQYSANPDTFYTQSINNTYHETLMTEACGNLLTEAGGYLLTK